MFYCFTKMPDKWQGILRMEESQLKQNYSLIRGIWYFFLIYIYLPQITDFSLPEKVWTPDEWFIILLPLYTVWPISSVLLILAF